MGFSLYCDRKSCRKEMQPAIDKNTKILYCTECGGELLNQDALTEFAKTQMITIGQIRRAQKTNEAYSVQCGQCMKSARPKVVKNAAVCSNCGETLNVSTAFLTLLKTSGRSNV